NRRSSIINDAYLVLPPKKRTRNSRFLFTVSSEKCTKKLPCACKLVLCLACWIGVTKTLSRCSLPQFRTNHRSRLSRKKRKLKSPVFGNLCLGKLPRPLNTSGLPEEVRSKKHRKFRPQHINFRRRGFSLNSVAKNRGCFWFERIMFSVR